MVTDMAFTAKGRQLILGVYVGGSVSLVKSILEFEIICMTRHHLIQVFTCAERENSNPSVLNIFGATISCAEM